MSRRRWVYTQGGEPLPAPIEVTEEWTNATPRAQTSTEELVYGNAIATDGTPINTRHRHREYLKANGLAMASDFKETLPRAEQRRRDIATVGGDQAMRRERREQVGRAAYELKQRKGQRHG